MARLAAALCLLLAVAALAQEQVNEEEEEAYAEYPSDAAPLSEQRAAAEPQQQQQRQQEADYPPQYDQQTQQVQQERDQGGFNQWQQPQDGRPQRTQEWPSTWQAGELQPQQQPNNPYGGQPQPQDAGISSQYWPSRPPPDYTELKAPSGKRLGSYKVHVAPRTWVQALFACISEKAQLVVPRSEAEAKAVGELYRKEQPKVKKANDANLFFVGASDLAKEGTFLTVLGTQFGTDQYFKWQKGEPNNHKKNEHCVLSNIEGLYRDGDCNGKHAFVCRFNEQGRPAPCPPPCTNVFPPAAPMPLSPWRQPQPDNYGQPQQQPGNYGQQQSQQPQQQDQQQQQQPQQLQQQYQQQQQPQQYQQTVF